ncbi:MAG TPA: malonate decarboxylase subunit alpha [Candidatus Copromorpha excrementipullorum]|uniref:Malonate decarboxylase subunit alpha n=1 Tax=Candidatus Allocopromorpha excrementipullorum TaxID=2840743 RepID=A0A9D1N6L9_9FIRM|nr:malonate decarboxylase subunit alpha [Candidatus Copromorpha excrementipullorum]
MTVKFIDAKEASKIIEDGSTVAIDAFISFCLADDIMGEIESRFIREGHPRDLNVINVAGIGGDGKDRGINHFAHKGLLRRFLCSNLSLANKVYPLIMDNAFPCFMIPQGVLSHMMRAIASGKPGVFTEVGMKTFVDPRVDGGRINDAAKECDDIPVQLINLNGSECLFYPAFPIDVAIIKGTKADRKGNISLEKEAMHLEQLEMATAARNSGGIVIVQVDEIVDSGALHPQKVTVPSTLVDYVVLGSPGNTGQHFIEGLPDPVDSWCGDEKIQLEEIKSLPLTIEKVICRRGIFEFHEDSFINLGIGLPMNVSNVLNEEGLIDDVSASIESGVMGGVPAPGIATGAAYNPDAILKQPDMFDFYDGGGIDFACLGSAEIDMHGNVNVSRFAGKVPGPGGFINITQGAKNICFMGTFTAGRENDIRIEDGKLRIVRNGRSIKFVRNVDHITFSGENSLNKGRQNVFYITERAVFKLMPGGPTLIEIAPGVDLKKDILALMEFEPQISDDLKLMDPRLFRPEPMGVSLKKK